MSNDKTTEQPIPADIKEFAAIKFALGQIFWDFIAMSADGKAIEGNPAVHRMAQWVYEKLHSLPPSPVGEAELKFVKASERLPKNGDYNARYAHNRCVLDIREGKVYEIRGLAHAVNCDDVELEWLEWLDESSNPSRAGETETWITQKGCKPDVPEEYEMAYTETPNFATVKHCIGKIMWDHLVFNKEGTAVEANPATHRIAQMVFKYMMLQDGLIRGQKEGAEEWKAQYENLKSKTERAGEISPVLRELKERINFQLKVMPDEPDSCTWVAGKIEAYQQVLEWLEETPPTPAPEVKGEPEEIRCGQCGSINSPDKDGVFRKKCWYCNEVLQDGGSHGDTERRETLAEPVKDTPVEKNFHCQVEIEGLPHNQCKNQCDHCREYYKPVDAPTDQPAHVPDIIQRQKCMCTFGPNDVNPDCAWPNCFTSEIEGEIPEELLNHCMVESRKHTPSWSFSATSVQQSAIAMYRKMTETPSVQFCKGYEKATLKMSSAIATLTQQREEYRVLLQRIGENVVLDWRQEAADLIAKYPSPATKP